MWGYKGKDFLVIYDFYKGKFCYQMPKCTLDTLNHYSNFKVQVICVTDNVNNCFCSWSVLLDIFIVCWTSPLGLGMASMTGYLGSRTSITQYLGSIIYYLRGIISFIGCMHLCICCPNSPGKKKVNFHICIYAF